jgi:hypothetical protein
MHKMSLNRNSFCTRCSPWTLTLCTQDVSEQELLAHKMYWTGTSCAQDVLNRNFLRTSCTEQELLAHKMSQNKNFLHRRCSWTWTPYEQDVPEKKLLMHNISLNRNSIGARCPWKRTLSAKEVPKQELHVHKMPLNKYFLHRRCPWTRTPYEQDVPEQKLEKKSQRARVRVHSGQWGSLGRQDREEGLQMKTLQLLNKNWVRHPQDSTLFMIYIIYQGSLPSIYNGTCYPYI